MSSFDKVMKELRKKFPTPLEVRSALHEARDQPDRVVAIVLPAIIEGMLQRVIEKNLVDTDPSLMNRLFQRRGPLSDFEGKADMALAMGWIDGGQAKEIDYIRNVRNYFAHTSIDLTFETPQIDSLIQKSPLVEAVNRAEIEGKKVTMDSKTAFVTMCYMAAIRLNIHYRKHDGESLIAEIVDLAKRADD